KPGVSEFVRRRQMNVVDNPSNRPVRRVGVPQVNERLPGTARIDVNVPDRAAPKGPAGKIETAFCKIQGARRTLTGYEKIPGCNKSRGHNRAVTTEVPFRQDQPPCAFYRRQECPGVVGRSIALAAKRVWRRREFLGDVRRYSHWN